jgi:hypothetical protein
MVGSALGAGAKAEHASRADKRCGLLSQQYKMMMKIKLNCVMAALVILSPASFAHAQHNHIQSSVSGQYDRRIHGDDRSAGAATQAIDNREQQPKTKKNKKVDSSAGPITERKN